MTIDRWGDGFREFTRLARQRPIRRNELRPASSLSGAGGRLGHCGVTRRHQGETHPSSALTGSRLSPDALQRPSRAHARALRSAANALGAATTASGENARPHATKQLDSEDAVEASLGEFQCDLSLGLEDAERLTAADHALTQPVAEPGIESLPVSPRLWRARSSRTRQPGSAST